jgi:hypothetical protein
MNKKREIKLLLQEDFLLDLHRHGDFWRILRKSTFVDLIKLCSLKFQKEHLEAFLIEIINLGIKAKILSHLEEVKQEDSLDEYFRHFNKKDDKDLIILIYNEFLNSALLQLSKYQKKDQYDLNKEIEYLKMINKLGIADFSDEVFDQIIGISMRLLDKDNKD